MPNNCNEGGIVIPTISTVNAAFIQHNERCVTSDFHDCKPTPRDDLNEKKETECKRNKMCPLGGKFRKKRNTKSVSTNTRDKKYDKKKRGDNRSTFLQKYFIEAEGILLFVEKIIDVVKEELSRICLTE